MVVVFQVVSPQSAFAYLDPGTWSYAIQILVAAFVGGVFALRASYEKIKAFFKKLLHKKPQI